MTRRRLNRTDSQDRSNNNNRSTQSNQQSNRSGSSVSLDFLGQPPPHNGSTSPSSSTSSAPQRQKQPRKRGRPKKFSPAINEILKLQRTTHLLIPRLPFQRVVREILQQNRADFRLQSQALEALRESSEMYLVQMFADALLCMIHARRVTLLNRDIHLLKALAEPRSTL